MVFQISQSNQSKYIAFATLSPWTHCGIIIEKDKDLYVLETSNVVKVTPLTEWYNKGLWGLTASERVIDEDIKIKYDEYLGTPYDMKFLFNNDKYYCSELIWVIYKEQFNVEICQPKPISDFNLIGLEEYIKKRDFDIT